MKQIFAFALANVTKTFIATVLLQLSGENRLNLDDSIENGCLVSFKETDMMVTRLRSKRILNHTSGIAEYMNSKRLRYYGYKKSYTAEGICRMGISLPPDFAPGKGLVLFKHRIRITGDPY
ncbi:serine hydrolase [Bacillus cereus]